MRRILWCLCLLFMAGCGTSSSAGTSSHIDAAAVRRTPAHFNAGSCAFKLGHGIVQGTGVRCGYLVVPEDHNRPSGPTIRLAVAVFKSPISHAAPDPVVFLQGGPGGRIVKDFGSLITADNASALVGRHDLILIDQRGNGLSRPALYCSELTALEFNILNRNVSRPQQATLEESAVRRCHSRIVHQGIPLNDYTTMQDAADIAQLGPALGYRSIDLYAVSYGTRVALTMMRSFPSGVRSVLLDSVVPPTFNIYSDPPRSEARLFRLIFSACAASASCNRHYPHLQSVFDTVVRRLNAHPARFRTTDSVSGKKYTVLLNGYDLGDLITSVPYVTSLIPDIPKMIYQVYKRRYGLASVAYGDVGFTYEDIDIGTYMSVECGEDSPYASAQQVASAVRQLPSVLQSPVGLDRRTALQECAIWHVAKVSSSQKQAVHDSVPTLIFEGEYDPITPPPNGALVHRTLSHSYFFVFPGTGHAVRLTDLCPNNIALAFFDHPGQKPDASCIGKMTEPFGR